MVYSRRAGTLRQCRATEVQLGNARLIIADSAQRPHFVGLVLDGEFELLHAHLPVHFFWALIRSLVETREE